MPAIERASYTGVASIMSGFDTVAGKRPWYSVWINRGDIMFQYNEDDYEEGRNTLEDALTALETAGHNGILIIKFHPKREAKGYIHSKTPVIASMHVRVTPLTNDKNAPAFINGEKEYYQLPGNNNQQLADLIIAIKDIPVKIKESQDALELRIAALEADDDDETQEPERDMFARVTGFLETPTGAKVLETAMPVIGRLTEMFQPFISKVFNTAPRPAPQNIQVSGTLPPHSTTMDTTQPQQQSEADYMAMLNAAIARLAPKCELPQALTKLADIAEKNPAMFTMLLTTLNNTTV